MELENVAIDACDPGLLGAFWEGLLGGTRITDEPDLVETRVVAPGGAALDVCVPRVPERPPPAPRLHLDLAGGRDQDAVVRQALALGARPLDIGQGDVPWVVLADPEGNPFCVMEEREVYADAGPIAALPLDSTDADRDLAIWRYLSGWVEEPRSPLPALRHPSGCGPLLELCPHPVPKDPGVKNRLHLDTRLAPHEDVDDVVARVLALGGGVVDHPWGDLPWPVLHDASGNEVCVLPART
ncbi:VOC family protein [Phycicoccus sp. BSK3Z-2]|uniref:VOC family protein n=1 Tax=Phycicoccus avicenniae TaxID=2828860 RepID=A0A941HYQ4_9MICO|nr:VOC family protein [Phycicoccus avicenniae]MBR7742100.1 VOC family protein [Phycicoccus avicenniae]